MDNQLDFIIADMRDFIAGEVVALGLNVNANLRDSPPLGTPIDTGWASANWVPSVGAPAVGGAEDNPDPARVAAQQAIAQAGVNEILGWSFNNGSIFSSNGVPYINRLNRGWSNQSPAGFVDVAVERALRQTAFRVRSSPSRSGRGR